ncbi:hypothetical protein Fmac_012307 [Flemingia macrophylla]|uniref:Uncharacterized protein n=1 Tax=Flemingia macrophylla TaxID=520843 RepID=A0ABD1MQB3_9FABA
MLNEVHHSIVEDPIQSMINDAFQVDMHHEREVLVTSTLDVHLDEDVLPNTTQKEHEATE